MSRCRQVSSHNKESMLKNVLATVAFNTGIAIVVAVLLIWFGDVRATSSMLELLLGSMIYSQLVGTTTSLAMEWLMPKLAQKRPVVFISCVAVLLTVTAFVGTVASTLVFSALGYGMKHFWVRVEYGMRISLVVTFVVGFIASMNGYYRRQLERAQQLATEAKLQSLESLVHPHFLFNTLNSISSLTHDDPDKADLMIGQMSALLRYSLDSAQGGLVEMAQELKIVRDYLEIQQTRFGERLSYSIESVPEAMTVKLPPMAIQTLVENSIKHAIGVSSKPGKVSVHVTLNAGRAVVKVADSGDGFDESKIRAGHGLDTLRSRLDALFAGRASLKVAGASVVLELPV